MSGFIIYKLCYMTSSSACVPVDAAMGAYKMEEAYISRDRTHYSLGL